MPETLSTRVTRLEKAMTELAEKTAILVDAQIRHENELSELRKEALERERRLDERIDKLISAIGEYRRRSNGKS